MRYILISGGMGNQMFQYALYLSMRKKGLAVLPVTSKCDKNFLDAFGIQTESNISGRYPSFLFDDSTFIHKVFKGLARLLPVSKYYIEREDSVYEPHVFNVKDGAFIEGYWQSQKYFKDCLEVVKSAFRFTGTWAEKNLEYKKQITSTNSVSIHIRRGDYLKYPKYLSICTDDYYARAITEIKQRLNAPVFYVFSNDLEWSKQLFKNENVVYVEGNNGPNSFMDLVLMTYCKHHILANSSFSWWGAALADEGGINIAPAKWLNNKQTPDIWLESWIKM